ncbi:hypothetical protein [Vibrio vulnificus]|uniref:hypothetical protein n=1 Tax=Vibrio vulnificus TaxID=672 RepID=UPI00102C4905|nr:hypothetical protein [Vibrio vulnificus]RZR40256.1 hypothetical protein D8T58_22230 [Vibrio vulnificus]RZR40264.1 hypothetical protein D8T58_22270 [Vibrio vulnificus]
MINYSKIELEKLAESGNLQAQQELEHRSHSAMTYEMFCVALSLDIQGDESVKRYHKYLGVTVTD